MSGRKKSVRPAGYRCLLMGKCKERCRPTCSKYAPDLSLASAPSVADGIEIGGGDANEKQG